ncbi:MAG: hypothetical protein RR338_03565 [Clostridia bacterium]
MINKYIKDGSLKRYKVNFVKKGIAKNDNPYTVFNINDNTKINNQWVSEQYSVFVWEELDVLAKDEIEFVEITALEVKNDNFQGKQTIKRTIFAKVNVIKNEEERNGASNQKNSEDSQPQPVEDILPF